MLKNIVIINDRAYISGGAGKVALTSAKLLVKKGLRVILFTAVGPVDPDLIKHGVEVICLGQNGILQEKNIFKGFIQGLWNNNANECLKELLERLDPSSTIIHFHGWSKALSPAIWNSIIRYQFKFVITMHDYFLLCPNMGLYNYQTRCLCNCKPSSLFCYLRNCDSRNYLFKLYRSLRGIIQMCQLRKLKGRVNIITISDTNKKVCYNTLNQFVKKWYTVQNPIDLNSKLIIDASNNKKYLFMARLSPEKGIDMFCEALSQLNLKGIVLGDGPISQKFKDKYPNIEFCGWLTGTAKDTKIRECKALIFPSLWYEGAPLTIPEILSYGIPCIVPDKCAASEIIKDGFNGYIFEIGNLESLINAINRNENSNIVDIQHNIMNSFEIGKYSYNHHVNSLLNVYHDMLVSDK
ncbi:glycosyltransferase family 4 protein [Segatella bryantii]|uniref:glycosyltransferase family 4 protein n=1 Tax=Segatella bryantii TaxID=77095 RepID=UPI00241F110F|nr:glycosyltransferase family 4 protein [Segatella bryantii]